MKMMIVRFASLLTLQTSYSIVIKICSIMISGGRTSYSQTYEVATYTFLREYDPALL